MAARNLLYILIGGFAGGVFLRSFFDVGVSFVAFLIALAVALLVLFFVRTYHAALLVALVLFAGALGVMRFELAELSRSGEVLAQYRGEEVTAIGVVTDEPDERQEYVRLTVDISTVNAHAAEGRVLVTTERFPEVSYGDEIAVRGTIELPETFENEQGRVVNYPAMLAVDGISHLVQFAEVEVFSSGHGNVIKRTLFKLKDMFLTSIGQVMPEPQASLLGGLVVGAKQSLGNDLLDDFRTTGIIHIVVLSGYNVTIVAEAIMRGLAFLPVYWSGGVGALAIVFFAIMTGAGATIVRASIMALLVLVARVSGRTYAITRALFVAGFIMVLHNPYILAFDPSFQLSFIATLGLVTLAPALEKRFSLVPTKFQLREFTVATIATQLFVLPLLLYYTGEFSAVALPVNLLVLLFIPVTMLLGFITGVLGLFSAVLALPASFVTYVLLTYELTVVDLFAKLPFSSVALPTFSFWVTVLAYVLYAVLLWCFFRRAHGTI